MTEWIIRRALSIVAGITARQWDAALDLVQQAARHLSDRTGAERKQYVTDSLHDLFSSERWKTWVLDALVGLAYGFAKQKGFIR